MFPYTISAEKKWVLKSWDRFEIPKPFTHAVMIMGAPIYVKSGASDEELEAAQQEVQRSLDDLRERGDSHWSKK